jgi:hypothetical protein
MFFGIRDPRWEKIRIRDKHPGSATLIKVECFDWSRLGDGAPAIHYFLTLPLI